MISRGFHSFKYLNDLIKELDFWLYSDIKIFKCIIPKGTKYYEGKFDAYQRTYIIESLDKSLLDVKYLYLFLSSYIDTLRKQAIGAIIKYIKLLSKCLRIKRRNSANL